MYDIEVLKFINALKNIPRVARKWEMVSRFGGDIIIVIFTLIYVLLMINFIIPTLHLKKIYFITIPILTLLITLFSLFIDYRFEKIDSNFFFGDNTEKETRQIRVNAYKKLILLKFMKENNYNKEAIDNVIKGIEFKIKQRQNIKKATIQALTMILAVVGLGKIISSYFQQNISSINIGGYIMLTGFIFVFVGGYVIINSRWVFNRKLNSLSILVTSLQNDFIRNKDDTHIYDIICNNLKFEFNSTITQGEKYSVIRSKFDRLIETF